MGYIVAADDILVVALNALSAELVDSDRISAREGGTLVLLCNASATGLRAQLKVDGKDITYDEEVDIRNAAVVFPDDLFSKTKVSKGDTISLKFRNDSGGNLNIRYRLYIE